MEEKTHQYQDEKDTILEVDSCPKIPNLTQMITYSVFLISWTSAYESNIFSIMGTSYADFRNQSNYWVCGQILTSSTSILLWWLSPLQGSDWIALRKSILQERCYSSVQATIDIIRWDPLLD